jgi:hypothetical protein
VLPGSQYHLRQRVDRRMTSISLDPWIHPLTLGGTDLVAVARLGINLTSPVPPPATRVRCRQ